MMLTLFSQFIDICAAPSNFCVSHTTSLTSCFEDPSLFHSQPCTLVREQENTACSSTNSKICFYCYSYRNSLALLGRSKKNCAPFKIIASSNGLLLQKSLAETNRSARILKLSCRMPSAHSPLEDTVIPLVSLRARRQAGRGEGETSRVQVPEHPRSTSGTRCVRASPDTECEC